MKNVLYKIEHALLNKGLINKEQLDKAKDVQVKQRIKLEDALVKLGFLTYSEIIQFFSSQYDLPVIDLDKANITPEIINLMPVQLVKKHHIVPVSKDNGVITIAVSSPPDLGFIDNLRFMFNADFKCVLATPENIKKAINKYYELEPTETVDTLLKELRVRVSPQTGAEIELVEKPQVEAKGMEDEGPIIQIVSLIINKAIASRASDIHVEPLSNRLRIRYRVDGVCQEADVLPKQLQESIISRIKILANIDISEKRRPQDGRIGINYQSKDLDIRVSCLPSIYGESVVMRLLEKSTILMNLNI